MSSYMYNVSKEFKKKNDVIEMQFLLHEPQCQVIETKHTFTGVMG